MTDFLNINYLKSGTARQQKAFEVLNENLILQKLSDFTPVLVGTIPINIDIASRIWILLVIGKTKITSLKL